MSRIFDSIEVKRVPRNNFALRKEYTSTGKIGNLIPVLCEKCPPGDTHKIRAEFFARTRPMLAPMMTRLDATMFSFFVPNRIIVGKLWEKYILSAIEGTEIPEMPKFRFNIRFSVVSILERYFPQPPLYTDYARVLGDLFRYGVEVLCGTSSILQYMGISHLPTNRIWSLPVAGSTPNFVPANAPLIDYGNEQIDAIPFLALSKIYDDYFRDAELEETHIPEDTDYYRDSDFNLITITENMAFMVALQRFIENEDYLPSAFSEDDKRFISSIIPIIYAAHNLPSDTDTILRLFDDKAQAILRSLMVQPRAYEKDYFSSAFVSTQIGPEVTIGSGSIAVQSDGYIESNFGLSHITEDTGFYELAGVATQRNVNLYGFTVPAVTINELRQANQLQKFREISARGGTRLTELIYSHFGIKSSDARLQRPEFLGGYKTPVQVQGVTQTSTPTSQQDTSLGYTVGRGISTGDGNVTNGNCYFEEHGWMIIFLNVRPRSSYMPALPRKFQVFDPLEEYFPEFDNLGEQEIKRKELFISPLQSRENDSIDEVFGYTPRYAEYKSSYSVVTGEMADTLDYYNLARRFDSAPRLNSDFIKMYPSDFNRIFEYQTVTGITNDHFEFEIYFNHKAQRMMSKYSTPKLIN